MVAAGPARLGAGKEFDDVVFRPRVNFSYYDFYLALKWLFVLHYGAPDQAYSSSVRSLSDLRRDPARLIDLVVLQQ